MKTHLEKFIDLYREFGIDCIVNTQKDGNKCIELANSDEKYPNMIPTLSSKFGGYIGFSSLITFDKDGNFVGQDFYE